MNKAAMCIFTYVQTDYLAYFGSSFDSAQADLAA